MTVSGTVAAPHSPVSTWDAAAGRIDMRSRNGLMVWRQWGAGFPVVLLHGGAGSWRHWIRTIPCLSGRFRVLAPDLPGLGESNLPPLPWSPAGSASVVAEELLRLLEPGERVDLVGFSAGAMLAGLVAARLGERCRTLVLVSAGGLGVPREPIVLEKVRAKRGEARRQAHRTNLQRLMIADAAKIDDLALEIQEWNTTHTRVSSVGFAASVALRDALPMVSARIAAIWGARDAVARATLDERCEVLRSLRPDVDIAVIPSAGHWVAYEVADAFNKTLVDMLDCASAAGRRCP
jgi:pimeloyl-ACP methyl ester carboxylesterase